MSSSRHLNIKTFQAPAILPRKRDISSHVAPRCKCVDGEFKFSNHKGDELIGDDELKSDAEIAATEEIPNSESVNNHHTHLSVDHPQQSESLSSLDINLSKITEEDNRISEVLARSEEQVHEPLS